MKNPSLRSYPRSQPAQVIPTPQGQGILEWLQSSGRMMPREEEVEAAFPQEEADLNALMSGDDGFDDDDDDDELEIE
ncbi:MAG: DUF3134 domain-containing protein [Cyanobacteria bacterium P01_E01_bin.6]